MKQIAVISFLLLTLNNSVIAQNEDTKTDVAIQSTQELRDEKLKQEIDYYKAQTKKLNAKPIVSDITWQVMIGVVPGILIVLIGGYITYQFNLKVVNREKAKVFERQRKAILVAIVELRENIKYILDNWKEDGKRPPFLSGDLITNQPYTQKSNDPSDFYFEKYYLVDTTYLLCSVLGWLELYRQDLNFLRNDETYDKQIQAEIKRLKGSFYQPFKKIKNDKLLHPILLPEELRAIGEKMLISTNNQMWVRGYASFSEHLFRLPEKPKMEINLGRDLAHSQDFWIHIMTRFLTYSNYSDKSLKERFNNLANALDSFIPLLDSVKK